MSEPAAPSQARPYLPLALWLLGGLVLLLGIDRAPAQRTQEARVLETARQMLGRPLNDWLIPTLNGELRLRKPPLCYWMSAGAFKLFNVSPGAGRLPSVLYAWLLLGVVYLFARDLLDPLTALCSAGALLGSYMFYRYMRFAETDAPSALFVTTAIWAIWRGDGSSRWIGWFQLSAVAIGLAAMSKGPPAAFPILFLIGLALLRRSPRLPMRWILSGAPLTAALVGGFWWISLYFGAGAAQIAREVQDVTGGADHPGQWWSYPFWMLWGSAPWSAFAALGVVAAIAHWRDRPAARIVILWLVSILLPLLLAGNKQPHYVLALMPPLMILTGWMLAAWVRREADLLQPALGTALAWATMLALLGAGVTVLAFGGIAPGAIVTAGALAAILMLRLLPAARSIAAMLATAALSIALLIGHWAPTRFERDPRMEAAWLKTGFGDGPYAFFGTERSIPLCFAMRQAIPAAPQPEPQANPFLLTIGKDGQPPDAPPPPYVLRDEHHTGDRVLRVYTVGNTP